MYSETHVKLFEDLMCGDKELMSHAESKLKLLKTLPIEEGLPVFISGMSSQKSVVAQLATLMLKKTYLDDNEVIKNLKPEEIQVLKSAVKQFVSIEKDWKSLQRLADVLGKLYAMSDLAASFSDIMTWFSTDNSVLKKFAIYIIEVLCELQVLKDNVVNNSIEDFKAIFKQALSHPDMKVQIAGLQAATQFLNNIQSDDVVMKFIELSENILESLVYVLKNDSDTGKAALISLNSLTDNHPKFWKKNLEILIQIICEIAKEKNFTNQIRESALEVIYGIAKKSPAFLRKSSNFSNLFIPILFQLLLDVDNVNNLDNWNKETEESEQEKDFMYFGVREGISRLSTDLGGKYFAESTIVYVKKLLSSENWIELHGAYIALGFMAQGCKDVFQSNIAELLQFISNGLVNAHPRVIYAALTALGMLLEELAPKIQNKYYSNILPALCKLMSTDDQALPLRVRTQACSALVNFLRGMIVKDSKEDDQDEAATIIKPYATGILQILSTLFETSLNINYAPLQEETLTNLSLMATIMDKDFAAYYTSIMPGLKQVFYNLNPINQQQAQLKSNAIDTISYLCSSISENSENFMGDLKELSESFAKLLASLKEEDPQVPALLTAFSHISTSMRENFYPYLELIFPTIQNYILADIGFKLEDADIGEYIPEDIASKEDKKLSVVLNMQGLDNKKLSMNTFALQNKIMALNVLHEICMNMGNSFHPYLERFLGLTKNLLKYPYSRKIRKLCIKSLYAGILSCKNEEEQKLVFNYMWGEVSAILAHNVRGKLLREIKAYLKVLTFTCEEIKNKNVYNTEFIVQLYQNLEEIVKFVEEHKLKVKDYVKNDEGLDENDEDILDSDLGILNETTRKVMELSGIIFKTFGSELTDLINKHLFNLFYSIWSNAINTTKNQQEILSSVCFFDDYLSYASQDKFIMFYPKFIEITDLYPTKNQDIIQSIVWGLGVIAQRLPRDEFTKVEGKVLTSIVNIISSKVTDDNSYTFDNAISSLGKYIYSQCDVDTKGIELASMFVSLLPLRYDIDEGQQVLKLFFQNLIKQHPLLVNEAVFTKIKDSIVRIVEFKKEEDDVLDEEGLQLFIEVCMGFGISSQN